MTKADMIDEIIEDLNYFVYWDFDQLKRHLDAVQEKWITRAINLELTGYFD